MFSRGKKVLKYVRGQQKLASNTNLFQRKGDNSGEQVGLGGDGEGSAAGSGEGVGDGKTQAGAAVSAALVPPDEAGGVVRPRFSSAAEVLRTLALN